MSEKFDITLIQMPVWPILTAPLGIACLASELIKNNFSVKAYDNNIAFFQHFKNCPQHIWEDGVLNKMTDIRYVKNEVIPVLGPYIKSFVKDLVHKQESKVLGFSVTELSLHVTLYTISLIKSMAPDFKIICGGPDIIKENELIKKHISNGLIDAGVIGEGEASLIELMRALKDGSDLMSIAGLMVPQGEEVIVTSARDSLAPEAVPSPDFRIFNLDLYQFKQLPLMMSRGCVASCAFCTEFIMWKKYSTKRAEKIFNEMQECVYRHGISDFFFCDSLMNGDHEVLNEFCQRIIDQGLKVTWSGFARVDKRLDRELLFKMKKAGCKTISFGLESGSQKILDLMNKRNTVSESHRNIKDAKDAGIHIHSLFIVGFPGETENDFQETMEFIYRNRFNFNRTSIGNTLTLPTISPMSRRPKKFNILTRENGEVYFDENGEWYSEDRQMSNPIVRKERLYRLQEFLEAFKMNWNPKPPQTSKGFMEFIIYRLRLYFLRQYYHLKFIGPGIGPQFFAKGKEAGGGLYE